MFWLNLRHLVPWNPLRPNRGRRWLIKPTEVLLSWAATCFCPPSWWMGSRPWPEHCPLAPTSWSLSEGSVSQKSTDRHAPGASNPICFRLRKEWKGQLWIKRLLDGKEIINKQCEFYGTGGFASIQCNPYNFVSFLIPDNQCLPCPCSDPSLSRCLCSPTSDWARRGDMSSLSVR